MISFSHSFTPFIPANTPDSLQKQFLAHYRRITHGTSRLFLFAADQKIEHLNDDFYGKGIAADACDPEHLFRIAQKGYVGALATQLGLIYQYGMDYAEIPYIVKLNSKTNLTDEKKRDPDSAFLWSVSDVEELIKTSELDICGVGCTVYLGGSYEAHMLSQAAQMVNHAHRLGLVAIVWIYPRALHLSHTNAPALLAGAAGLGAALGADFVKIQAPETRYTESLSIAARAAGRTGVICSGGKKIDAPELLKIIHAQLQEGNMSGCAIGRNIFQRPLQEAIALTQAISALVYENKPLKEAVSFLSK